jgi:Zinc finger, C3HC4 type (RING finger)
MDVDETASATTLLDILRSRILPVLASSLTLVLPTSMFLLKFLEWWTSSPFPRHLKSSLSDSLDLPPPALPQRVAVTDTCPICSQPIVNPTAMIESGHVFCYKCIFAALEKDPRCPVTHIPALSGTSGLRRIRI